MDSPLASPRFDPTPCSDDDDSNSTLLAAFRQWTRSIKPLYKAASAFIFGMALCALVFSSVPLWRPMGMIMLHKLWDILRFVLVTTSIGLGIINSKLWRGNNTEGDVVESRGRNEDAISSKVSFAGLFYSDFQPSHSFSDKEQEGGEHGFVSRDISEVIGRDSDDERRTTPRPTVSAKTADGDGDELLISQKMGKVQVSDTIADGSNVNVEIHQENEAKVDEEDGYAVEKPLKALPSADNARIDAPTLAVKRRLRRRPRDDMDLTTVVEDDQPKHNSKITHRRGSSLEFPIEQGRTLPRHGDIYSAMDSHRTSVDKVGERDSSSRKASSFTVKDDDHVKAEREGSSSSNVNMNVASASARARKSSSRHSRSRSAYDLKEVLVDEPGPGSKSRGKPSITRSQLARRRNVSLSCDLDKEYAVGGVPAWLASLPSPPMPPLMDGYGVDASKGVLLGELHEDKQEESSLRKAYSESLAPWRAATKAIPEETCKGEGGGKGSKMREDRKQSKGVKSPPSSPSTPGSFVGSPSPAELNKKVDAFIAKFHERMRLQRLESLKRSRQRQNQ